MHVWNCALQEAAEAAMLACEETQFSDELYLVAADCGQSYVVCQSGSVVYSRLCPPGTRFHLDRLTCLDQQLCLADHQHRDPRQIKFSDFTDAWGSRPVAGSRIKLKSLESAGYDGGMARRQIKFRSLPEEFNPESDISDKRRQERQIKFRSLSERDVKPKKHEERRRQIKFDLLNDYATDPLNALYYRRR